MKYCIPALSLSLLLGIAGSAHAQDAERAQRLLPADRIKSVDKPKFSKSAKFLNADDEILGVVVENKARAYPLLILNSHEVCNDTLGKTGISVTW